MAESERESKDSPLRFREGGYQRKGGRKKKTTRTTTRDINPPEKQPGLFPPLSLSLPLSFLSPPIHTSPHRSNVFAVLSREILQLEFIAVVTKRLLPSRAQLLPRPIFSSLFLETTTTTTTTDSATSEKPSDHPPGSSLPASVSAFKGLHYAFTSVVSSNPFSTVAPRKERLLGGGTRVKKKGEGGIDRRESVFSLDETLDPSR